MALAAQRTGADVASNAIQGDGSRSPMKIFYCFHQNNESSKCEVAHTSLLLAELVS